MNRTWIELDRGGPGPQHPALPEPSASGLPDHGRGEGGRLRTRGAGGGPSCGAGIRHFATATLDEAVQLREAGIRGVRSGIQRPCVFPPAGRARLTQTATCRTTPPSWRPYCRENGVPPGTYRSGHGYARIGFLPEDLDAIGGCMRTASQVTASTPTLRGGHGRGGTCGLSRRQARSSKAWWVPPGPGRGAGDASPSEQTMRR